MSERIEYLENQLKAKDKEIEELNKANSRRDRFIFYWGMFAGCLLTIMILIINRI